MKLTHAIQLLNETGDTAQLLEPHGSLASAASPTFPPDPFITPCVCVCVLLFHSIEI